MKMAFMSEFKIIRTKNVFVSHAGKQVDSVRVTVPLAELEDSIAENFNGKKYEGDDGSVYICTYQNKSNYSFIIKKRVRKP